VNVVTHQTKSDDGIFIKLFANGFCECYMKTESDDGVFVRGQEKTWAMDFRHISELIPPIIIMH
jgi:hypothetical protein